MYKEYDRIAAKNQTPYPGTDSQNDFGQTAYQPESNNFEQAASQPVGNMNHNSYSAPQSEASQQEPSWLDKAGYAANQAFQNADMLNQDRSISNDKYKHAYISCQGAQNGGIGAATIGAMGIAKEIKDLARKGWNQYSNIADRYNLNKYGEILRDSIEDIGADTGGMLSGLEDPNGNCEYLVSRRYKKRI